VGIRHELRSSFRRCIETYGTIDVVPYGEGHLRVSSVDGARRGVDKMICAAVSTCLQHVERPGYVAVDVGARSLERIPDACLRRQMDDSLGSTVERGRYGFWILEITFDEVKPLLPVKETRHARFLQARVVVVIEVVDGDDLVPTAEQGGGHV